MEMKEEIIKILMENFDSVYCDTCEYEDSSRCDECHRKSMNWGISENCAEQIADKILRESSPCK